MANFPKALEKTLIFEGGYSNHSNDRHGETYAGITRVNFPAWPAWFIIDKNKPLKQGQIIRDERLKGMIEAFYLDKYWYKVQGDKINNQAIAEMLFDWTVNSGYHAAKALQKVVGEVADGVIGPKTLAAVNAGCQEQIFTQFNELRIKFYNDIVIRNESQRVFLKGWLNRTMSFTFQ
jgi:lysozyme family protein